MLGQWQTRTLNDILKIYEDINQLKMVQSSLEFKKDENANLGAVRKEIVSIPDDMHV